MGGFGADFPPRTNLKNKKSNKNIILRDIPHLVN
jgi:hypothetical protein